MAPKQSPKPEFQEGERVLCFHGPLLYEAKCLKLATEDKQVRYLIHYSGWNKNWDEWVPENRVLKYSEANLQKQRDLQRANQEQRARGAPQGRKGSAAVAAASLQQQQQNVETLFQNIRITPSTSSSMATAMAKVEAPGRQTRKCKQKSGPREGGSGGAGASTSASTSTSMARGTGQPLQRRRTRGHSSARAEGTSAASSEAKVQIPERLKPLLVEDWDLVTKQKLLFSLPARKNVDSILEDYVTYQKARGEQDNTVYAAEDLVGGIRAHFNALLGTQLLYEFERPQYAEILANHPDVPMSQLYGAPHLLRLFVPIGEVLAHSSFDEKSLALLFNYLHDFLKYLAKNPSAFFNASEYKVAPPEYRQKVA
ncbi:mortality factor 4-like protein 1 [Monodelphis domestica]|uniref:mortality factor 4-like protein 1 n=1 Tax=Monodelphis domestica TaxID=13616 RepID=UPI0024E23197|nr:mortality factor 4-like protein 1 [Monodelphis domestica]